MCVSRLEVRDEKDAEIKRYLQDKEIISLKIKRSEYLKGIEGELNRSLEFFMGNLQGLLKLDAEKRFFDGVQDLWDFGNGKLRLLEEKFRKNSQTYFS